MYLMPSFSLRRGGRFANSDLRAVWKAWTRDLLFSKQATGRFPEDGEIVGLLEPPAS